MIELTEAHIQKFVAEYEKGNKEIIDGRIKGEQEIGRAFQESHTMGIFQKQADQNDEDILNEYEKDVGKWMNSANSRSRMVIVEASNDFINTIAEKAFNAGPKPRMVIVGLNDGLKEKLKVKLIELWTKKLQSSEDYRKRYVKLYQNGNESKNWEALLKERSLEEFLGPHNYKEDLDISFEAMNKAFPEFDKTTDEVFLLGENNHLAYQLGNLGRTIEGGAPIYPLRSKPVAHANEDLGNFKAAANDIEKAFDAIGSSKLPDYLSAKTGSDYKNITLDSTYREMFQLQGVKDFMKSEVNKDSFNYADRVEQEDLDYLRSIIYDEPLYRANASPKSLDKTLSDASSNIAEGKGKVVSKTLMSNLWEKPESSIVESEFSAGDMLSDGGNDIIAEKLRQRNAYKTFFEESLSYYQSQGKSVEEAKKWAIAQTIETYNYIEKINPTIKDLIWGETGAQIWRDFGIHESGKLIKANTKANNYLKPSPYLFGAGAALSITGLTLSAVLTGGATIPTLATALVGFTGTGAYTVSKASLAKSLYHQIKTNKIILGEANKSLAIANGKMLDAQNERTVILKKRLKDIKNNVVTKKTDQDRIPVATYDGNFQANKTVYKERLRGILKKVDAENDFEIEKLKGEITPKELNAFVNNLYSGQAAQNIAVKKEEYARNLAAWKNSVASRPRLAIIEANKHNLEFLANRTLNAAPSVRVLITGLDETLQKAFSNHLKEQWRKKLQIGKYAAQDPKQKEISDNLKKQFFKQYCEKEWHTKMLHGAPAIGQGNINEQLRKRQETINKNWDRFFTENTKTKPLDDLVNEKIKEASLPQLLGPHLSHENSDIRHETLSQRFEEFDANVEEVICYGENKDLAKHLGDLGHNIGGGVPIWNTKSSPINDDEPGLWKSEVKGNPENLIGKITSGESAEDMFQPNEKGGYNTIKIDPTFNRFFDINFLKGKLEEKGLSFKNLKQEDVDFLENIFIKEPVYPAETSPKAFTKTMGKASSKLMADAGKKVGSVLWKSGFGIPESTGKEVEAAIEGMVKDGGTDLVKEQLGKKNTYKQFYETLRVTLMDQYGKSPEEAQEMAFLQMADLYQKIEYENKKIQQLDKGDADNLGAEHYRKIGLLYTNKAKKATKKGLKWLKAVGIFNATGVALQAVSIPMSILSFAIPVVGLAAGPGVWLGMNVAGVALQGAGMGCLYKSTKYMEQVNGELLTKANRAFKRATYLKYEAQTERAVLAERQLKAINENLKEGKQIQVPVQAQELAQSQHIAKNVAHRKSETEILVSEIQPNSSVINQSSKDSDLKEIEIHPKEKEFVIIKGVKVPVERPVLMKVTAIKDRLYINHLDERSETYQSSSVPKANRVGTSNGNKSRTLKSVFTRLDFRNNNASERTSSNSQQNIVNTRNRSRPKVFSMFTRKR